MTTNRIDAKVPPHSVYAVLLDAYAYPKWVVGSKRIRGVDPDWPAPGSRFHHTVGAPAVDVDDSSKLLEADEDRRVVLEVRFRPAGVGVVTMELEPTEDGRRTRISMTERPKAGPVHQWWSRPLEALTFVRNQLSLRRLAHLAEQRAMSSPR
jgi:uncharacterized protein YndB with AHSA1/START domain